MEKTGWKITAIVFITLFILLSVFVIYIWNMGAQMIANENECAINICGDYDTYYYDDYEETCYCFTGEDITQQKYLG